MSKHTIVINEVINSATPVVRGQIGDITFEASPFRWGSKMLMKVEAEGLDRGQRVAIGQKAKAALRELKIELPKAELVRPRKAKEEEAPTPDLSTLEALEGMDELR